MKYEDWLNDWLENYVEPSTKFKTHERYEAIVRLHIAPQLGNYDIAELTPNILQHHVSYLLKSGNNVTGEGLAPNTVNSIITVIQDSLKMAQLVFDGIDYIGDKIKRPKTQEKKVDCFTIAEQKTMEKYIMENRKSRFFGVILCLYTGLRIGELLSLEWSDIDFGKNEISVTKTCHYGKDKSGQYARRINSTKTFSSMRVIPFPKQLLSLLKDMKKNSKANYVVSNKEKPVSTRAYQKSFKLLLIKLNIPHKRFHSLRHTFATRALECGMDVKTLSEILGHKSPTITLSRYAHSMLDHKKEMMNKLGKLF